MEMQMAVLFTTGFKPAFVMVKQSTVVLIGL
jgi:hypothetical protein